MEIPRSTYFLISSGFGESFCWFGLKIILPLYFVDVLLYNQNMATILYHTIIMLAFFFPLFGGMLADTWLGTYKTILFLSIFYGFGILLLFVSSISPLNLPTRELSMFSLLLISLSHGSINSCSAVCGGEQFDLPRQNAQLSTYFSLRFLVLNMGSFLSTLILPILRKDVMCFDQNTCYPLAFLVSTILVFISIGIFLGGTKLYKIRKPQGNVAFNVAKCISYAIMRKIKSNENYDHWLDHAKDQYDKRMIKDVKIFLNILKVLTPLPIFWALRDQMGSRWTFQAINMDGKVFDYLIKPDQFHLVHSVLTVILIPLFQMFVYPCMERFLFINTPLRKLTVALLLAGVAFIVYGILELNLEQTFIVQPSTGLAQVRIFNTINCNTSININNQQFTLNGLDMYKNISIPVKGNSSLNFLAEYNDCHLLQFTDTSKFIISSNLEIQEAKAFSWALTKKGLSSAFPDNIMKSKSRDPLIRALIYINDDFSNKVFVELESSKKNYNLDVKKELEFTKFIEINSDRYDVRLDNKIIAKDLLMKYGGVYTIVGHISKATKIIHFVTVVQPNSIHIFWQLPQYILISIGEIMFEVTGAAFIFTQSPIRMKSMVTACWLMTISIGNLIVIIVTKTQLFERQVMDIFLFAILTIIDMLIFLHVAKSYKYVEMSSNDSESDS